MNNPVDAPTPRTEPPISTVLTPVDFPRTFNAAFTALSGSIPHRQLKAVTAAFAIQLERELIAATAELERTKEQLRVARFHLELALESDELDDIRETPPVQLLRSTLKALSFHAAPIWGG